MDLRLFTTDGRPTSLQADDRLMFRHKDISLVVIREGRPLRWDSKEMTEHSDSRFQIFGLGKREEVKMTRGMLCDLANLMAAAAGLQLDADMSQTDTHTHFLLCDPK